MNKLYRSERDKKIFGLCGGLAQWLNVDATLIRVLFVIAGVFSAGSVIFVYVLASLVIPKEPTGMFPPPGCGGHGYYGGYNGAGPQPNHANYPPFTGGPSPMSGPAQQARSESDLDSMMKDVEKKALWKEIEELRARLEKYEKGDK